MLKFKPITVNRKDGCFKNIEYLPRIMFLYRRYEKFLKDDYAVQEDSFFEYFVSMVEDLSPYFWVILADEDVAGFVYLENFTGDMLQKHGAEITTCFDKKYWGGFTYYAALVFFDYCFEKLGLKKIKALIYPENFRVIRLLKRCGFEKEGLLKSETIRSGRLQDIEVYSLISKT